MARILIVDDEPACSKSLAALLAQDGHQVRAATRGHEAVDLGIAFRPDILIADWLLPDRLNGAAIAQRIRTSVPAVEVIFVTGLVADDIARLAAASGLERVTVMEKPCDIDAILQVVRSAVARASTSAATPPELRPR